MALTLLASAPDGTALRLQMTRAADRLESRIDLLLRDEAIPLLESVEGLPLDPWPPSPPWQQCQLHPAPHGVLLATGMAGNSHWSVSIESHARPPALAWDVACRARQSTLALGSIYRIPRAVTSLQGGQIRLQIAGTTCRLWAESVAGVSADLRLDENDGVQVGVYLPPQTVVRPQTFRWKYRLELASQADATQPPSRTP